LKMGDRIVCPFHKGLPIRAREGRERRETKQTT